uniref:Uncharacterized protein n=1 Tax=Oncorhynchus tshawytscha TaxID=74940 RepID=A0AAZ3P8X2_ONCTS
MWLHPPGKTNLDLPEHNTRFHSQGSARRLQEAHQTQHTRGLANRWNPMTGLLFRTMTKYSSRLCKGYLTKKESDGVLHQMTWVWDEFDCRVKEKQPTNAQHMWELL